jgi:hypothetical protein
VETTVGHGLRRNELPAGKVRLHDLEPGGHPVQYAEQIVQAGPGARCGPEAEDRLGLDARLAQAGQRQRAGAVA